MRRQVRIALLQRHRVRRGTACWRHGGGPGQGRGWPVRRTGQEEEEGWVKGKKEGRCIYDILPVRRGGGRRRGGSGGRPWAEWGIACDGGREEEGWVREGGPG